MEVKSRFSNKAWIYPLAIAVFGFLYYISFIQYGISLSDEGFLLDGAERVLRGQLPVSHFTSYTPGSYFLLALLFKFFGANLLISRLMEIAFLLINAVMMFHISKRLMSDHWALIPPFLLVLIPGPWHKVFFAFGLLLPLIALLRFLEKRTTLRVVMLGSSIGIASVFKFEAVFYSLITVWIVLFMEHTWGPEGLTLNRNTVTVFFKNLFLCSLSCLLIVALFLIYYQSQSALSIFFSSIRGIYGTSNVSSAVELFDKPSLLKAFTRFHIGNLSNLFFYLILLLYLYFLGKTIAHLLIERRKNLPVFFPIFVMGSLSLTYAYNFFGKSHLLQSAAMAYPLIGHVICTLANKKGIQWRMMLIFFVSLLALYLSDSLKWRNYFYSGSISRLYAIQKVKRGCISSEKAKVHLPSQESDSINEMLGFFQGKEGYLMSLYYEPMFNFLTGKENPTQFTILLPSFIQDPSKQKKVIDEVERYKIRYLLVPQRVWQNQNSGGMRSYAPILYEFVVRCYGVEKEIGDYLIFCRLSL